MSSVELALLAALVWGTAAFCEKLGLGTADPLVGVFARTAGVLAGGLAFAFLFPGAATGVFQLSWRALLPLMTGGLLASVVGQLFFYQALKGDHIGRVAAVGGSWPVFAFFLSLIFLKEPPTVKKILGVALVAMGVALLK